MQCSRCFATVKIRGHISDPMATEQKYIIRSEFVTLAIIKRNTTKFQIKKKNFISIIWSYKKCPFPQAQCSFHNFVLSGREKSSSSMYAVSGN